MGFGSVWSLNLEKEYSRKKLRRYFSQGFSGGPIRNQTLNRKEKPKEKEKLSMDFKQVFELFIQG